MKSAYRKTFVLDTLAMLIDWLTFNIALLICNAFGWWGAQTGGSLPIELLAFNVSYLLSIAIVRSSFHHRWSTIASILRNAFIVSLLITLFNSAILGMAHLPVPGYLRSLTVFAVIFLLITLERLSSRKMLMHLRLLGYDAIRAVLVGDTLAASDLIRVMDDEINGYDMIGVFSDSEPEKVERKGRRLKKEDRFIELTWLGKIADAEKWVTEHGIDEVYICADKSYDSAITSLQKVCMNKMTRVFYVPGSYSDLKRNPRTVMFGDTRVLSLYNEPLLSAPNRILKRVFDVCFSLVVLCTIFPIALVVVFILTKITMPGPIFFGQKRTGYDGRTFTCYKFRSMKVNKEADSVQATKDDSRITKWGHIMRHTNIDELPQFFNVLIGDMSVVGPRPHMLAHTDYYSRIISDYMVRHYVKPGITGWAQINGCRGETSTVDEMALRVEKDIWYIENWSLWLDLQIILKTTINIFKNDKKAY